MPTRRQALMRAYVPAQAYAEDLAQITGSVASEVERSDALAKLASDARDQLARTTEATRVRVETGQPLSPTDIEFLRSYVAKSGAAGGAVPAIPPAIRTAFTNDLASGTRQEAWNKAVSAVSKLGSTEQKAAALQALYADPQLKGYVSPADLNRAAGATGIAAEGYSAARLLPGSTPIRPRAGGVSTVDQTKADALGSALQEAGPSGFAGGPEGRAWRASLDENDSAILEAYVSALSDPTSTKQALAAIPKEAQARAKQLYQEAVNNGGYSKAQSQLYSAAMQTAIRSAQEAEERASEARVDYRSPAAEARKRALAAQGVTDSASAVRALFRGTGLEDRVGSIMARTKDPKGHEPQNDFEEAIRKAWAAGVRPEDLDQVLSARPGQEASGTSSGWKDAIKGFKARWKTPTDQRDAARAYYTGLGVQDAVEKARKITPTKAEEYARTKKDTEEQAASIEQVRNAPPGPNETKAQQAAARDRAASNAKMEEDRKNAAQLFRDLVDVEGMDEVEAKAEVEKHFRMTPPEGRIEKVGERTQAGITIPAPVVEAPISEDQVAPPATAPRRTAPKAPPVAATPPVAKESARLYTILQMKGADGKPAIAPGSPQYTSMLNRIRELRAGGN